MGDEKKKNVLGKITPKKVKARRRADGTVQVLEEVKSSEESEDVLGGLSFGDRSSLLDDLAAENDLFADSPPEG